MDKRRFRALGFKGIQVTLQNVGAAHKKFGLEATNNEPGTANDDALAVTHRLLVGPREIHGDPDRPAYPKGAAAAQGNALQEAHTAAASRDVDAAAPAVPFVGVPVSHPPPFTRTEIRRTDLRAITGPFLQRGRIKVDMVVSATIAYHIWAPESADVFLKGP